MSGAGAPSDDAVAGRASACCCFARRARAWGTRPSDNRPPSARPASCTGSRRAAHASTAHARPENGCNMATRRREPTTCGGASLPRCRYRRDEIRTACPVKCEKREGVSVSSRRRRTRATCGTLAGGARRGRAAAGSDYTGARWARAAQGGSGRSLYHSRQRSVACAVSVRRTRSRPARSSRGVREASECLQGAHHSAVASTMNHRFPAAAAFFASPYGRLSNTGGVGSACAGDTDIGRKRCAGQVRMRAPARIGRESCTRLTRASPPRPTDREPP